MILVHAFIFATAWAYLACAVYTVLGKPPMVGVDARIQTVFYLCTFVAFLYVAYNPGIMVLNLFLGIAYGFGAVGSFIGYPQRWAAYWRTEEPGVSDAGQIEMAFWDLALAVAFLSLV